MLDRQKDDLVFGCDGCGDVLETSTADFDAALNMLRRSGWKAENVGPRHHGAKPEWVHFCPDCKLT